jgi:hypothetical protein
MMSTNTTLKRRTYWKWAPVVLLGSLLSGLASMIVIASNDPSFAVEPQYYEKALAWDLQRQQELDNDRLGYRVAVAVDGANAAGTRRELTLHLHDAAGKPLSGAVVDVTTFHNARAANVLRAKLVERSPGTYTQRLPLNRAGIWELRVVATYAGSRFTHVARVELTPEGTRS